MISISVSLQLSLRDLTTLFMELFSNNEQQLEIILSLIIVKCHTNLVSIVNYKSKINNKINQKLALLDSIFEVFGIRFNKNNQITSKSWYVYF